MTKAMKIYIRVMLAILPMFFLPIIYDAFGLGKSSFLLLSGGVGVVLWVVSLLTEKKAELKYSKWFWWMGILFIWSIISFLRMTPGAQARSVASPLGVGGFAGLMIWFFLWLQVRSEEETKKQFLFLSISGLITGIISLVVFMIPASKLPLMIPKDNPLVSITSNWTLAGSMIAEMVLFLFLFVNWIWELLPKLK